MVPCSNIWLNSKVKQAVWIFFVTSWWIVLIRVVMMCRALAFSMRTVDSPSLRLPSKSWPADRLLSRVSQWNWPWARLTRIQPGLAEIAVVNRTLNPAGPQRPVRCSHYGSKPPGSQWPACRVSLVLHLEKRLPAISRLIPGYPRISRLVTYPGYLGISRDGQVVLGYARIRFL